VLPYSLFPYTTLFRSLIFDQGLGHYVLEVSAPILDDAQQKAVGAVNVRLRPDELFKAIQEVRLGERGHAMLLNSAGKPLICPIRSEEHTSELQSRGHL